MHKLLSDQLKFVFGSDLVPPQIQHLINIIDQSYQRYDQIIRDERKSHVDQVKAKDAQIQDDQARLEASIKSLNLGFILTDLNKQIVMINSAAKFILFRHQINQGHLVHSKEANLLNFECSLEDVASQLSSKVDLKALIDQSLTTRRPVEVSEIEFDEVYLRLRIIPIIEYDGEIKVIGTVILLGDVTEIKRVEQAKDEFFSIASHELRTPLTAIQGNSALIKMYYQDKVMDKSLKQMIDDISLASNRLSGIVNDFLDISRLEQGRIKFAKDEVSLLDIINQACRELESIALNKRIYLKIENPNYLTPYILADEKRLKQVLINLIGNAIKFTWFGGVSVSLDEEADQAIVRVKDTGEGIGQKDRQFLFHKFKQLNEDIYKTNISTGTGLGLYICKLLMDGMSGEIELESSSSGKGSVFKLKLPLVKSDFKA